MAIAYLSIANEIREIAGEAKAIVTIFEKWKTMLQPMPAYDIVVGLVLEPSVNGEDCTKNIGREIERLLLAIEEEA